MIEVDEAEARRMIQLLDSHLLRDVFEFSVAEIVVEDQAIGAGGSQSA